MAAIANIVAFDGQSTPVTHTFVAESVSRSGADTIATYKETIAGVPDYAQGRITMKRTKLKSGVTRNSVRGEFPVMESVSGVNAAGYTATPKVAYVNAVEFTNFAHERSTIADRRGIRQLVINVAGNVSTSVAPVTTGPVPELIDLGIAPT
jgi:hypothetical protein